MQTTVYTLQMLTIQKSGTFNKWLDALKDTVGRARILDRIDRVRDGNFGDTKPVGDGVFELRFSFSPGYRVYFIRQSDTVVVLLCGGDKSSQDKDLKRAKRIAQEYAP